MACPSRIDCVFTAGMLLALISYVYASGVVWHVLDVSRCPTCLASSHHRAVGFVNDYMAFIGFCIVVTCIQIVGEALGLFCLAIFDNPNIANSVSALYISFTAMLSAGFLRYEEKIFKAFIYSCELLIELSSVLLLDSSVFRYPVDFFSTK